MVVLLNGTTLEDDRKKRLLEKYLQGTCSQEEREQLYAYLKDSPTNDAYREVADRLWADIQPERVLPDERAEAMLHQVFRHPNQRTIPVYWYRMAAVLGGLALLASLFYLSILGNPQTIQYATDYGEIKTIWLPDSSRVTLNANSSLVFRTGDGQGREAWLEGEAFFEIRKMSSSQPSSEPVKFVVHTDNLDVAVLGTAFNVNDRRGTTQVVLKHGSVRLETKHHEHLTMQPGELAELAPQTAALTKQAVDPNDFTTWRENKLVFKRTSIREVARILEDYYGLEVVLEGEGWDDRKITGSIPTTNQEVFLEVLNESMGIRMTREGNRIVLKNDNPASTQPEPTD